MAIATQPDALTEAPRVLLPGPIYRLSADQYLRMARSGILTEDDRVELLEGVIASKMGKNPPHILVTKRTVRILAAIVPPGWMVAKEDPFQAIDSVPEPDCMVVRGADEDYADRLPQAHEIALVVEVADTTLLKDQEEKKRIYARARIPIYWIVNLVGLRVEVYGGPTGPDAHPDYHTRQDYGPDDEVPVVIDGREVGRVAVRDLLP